MPQRDYYEKDYYGVLGVTKGASTAEIAKAYRRLARENHPDTKPDDPKAEARFKEISEAHSVLSSDEKRKEYDGVRELVGSNAYRRGSSGAGGGAGGFDLGDLLGQVFGQGGGGAGSGTGGFGGARRANGTATPTQRRGRDLETSISLGFSDALAGVTTTLRVNGRAQCSTCGGSGAAPGTSPVTCTVCGGAGVTASNQGLFSFSEPCTACGGTGRQIPTPCPTCDGTGIEVRPREIRTRIPAGVKDAARIRLAAKGEPGPNGGPAGDLYVNVRVEPHPVFGLRGDDLTVTVPVTFAEAALGTRVLVPVLDGDPVTVKVPGGTESGKVMRVRGRGVARPGGASDLLVTVEVVVPKHLTRTQRKALEAFADLEGEDVRAHLADFVKPAPAEA